MLPPVGPMAEEYLDYREEIRGSFVNVTPVFSHSNLSSSALFSCAFLSFLGFFSVFRRFETFVISSSPSLTHCLCPPTVPVPAALLSSSLSLPVSPFPPLISTFLFILVFLCASFYLSRPFSFSDSRGDECLDRAIPLLCAYRLNLRGHAHQQLGILSE